VYDGKDLARSFPGHSHGSATEQLASVIATRFIAEADFFCDLHAPGNPYEVFPLAGYYHVGGDCERRQHGAAVAFGAPLVWATTNQPGRSLGVAAELGTPAIYTEIGGLGRALTGNVTAYCRGLFQLLAYLGMMEGPFPTECQWFSQEGGASGGHMQMQHRVSRAGFFRANVGLWDDVSRSHLIGTLVARDGRVLEKVRADRDGRVVMLRTQAAMAAGDSAAVIVSVTDTDEDGSSPC
jgi:predicted deacylase